MKKIRKILLPLLVVAIIVVASGYSKSTLSFQNSENANGFENEQKQTVNMFVTHGHCSTPFSGIVEGLKVNAPVREDLGNPIEAMTMSFEIDPNSFNVCAGKELTAKIKTPGLFISANDEKITFKSTNVYTMGLDWYQVNGTMSIKGIEKDVKFFVTGIRDPKSSNPDALILEGKVNLQDWGIDYDLIVNGKSDNVPTKWMHINMKIDLS